MPRMNNQPSAFHPPRQTFRIVYFDCDSTLVSIEGIDELARLKGQADYIAALTRRAMDGEVELEHVFVERWYQIAIANGKDAQRLDVDWGQPITPDLVETALAADHFEAITIAHNETSTGVISPLRDIAARVRARFPDVLLLVDAVSSLGGVEIDFNAWGLDVLLTSSQKCLALPPGLAFAAVSDRALDKARRVPQRGLYFDFVEWEKYLLKNQTLATPAISLLWALDVGLDRIFAEGLANRFARHAQLAARTQAWASQH